MVETWAIDLIYSQIHPDPQFPSSYLPACVLYDFITARPLSFLSPSTCIRCAAADFVKSCSCMGQN